MKDRTNETSGVIWHFENIMSAASYSVKYLTKLGQISFEETGLRELTVLPTRATTDYRKTVVVRESSEVERRFQDFPVNLQLLVFSYLDAKTLCRIALTCQYWRMLSEDKVLWSNLLSCDLQKWKSINHMTYPPAYLETNSELTPKQIYTQCCPSCQTSQPAKVRSFATLFQNLPHWFGKRPLRVVMFGPGLESETKHLTRKLLWDPKSPFKVMGMFPGEFEGVGSGVCLKQKAGNMEINLITLYGSTRTEREARVGGERVSKLLAAPVGQDDDQNDHQAPAHTEVSHRVKELCNTVDAFIYVVDSSAQNLRVNTGDQELQALMNVSSTKPRVPLLVLSCVAMETSLSLSCARVIQLLQMPKLSRPWQVNSVCVETLEGFLDGISWLLRAAA